MNIKNYLKSIRKYDAMINYKKQQLEELKLLAHSISSHFGTEPVQTSTTSDRVANSVARILDLEAELLEDIEKYIKLKQEAMTKIDQLDDPVMIDVLAKRYFEFKPWHLIADELGYTEDGIYKLHGKALLILNNKEKENNN